MKKVLIEVWEDETGCLVWRCYQCKKIVYEELKPLRLRGKNHEKEGKC